jgi:hypothetical protein
MVGVRQLADDSARTIYLSAPEATQVTDSARWFSYGPFVFTIRSVYPALGTIIVNAASSCTGFQPPHYIIIFHIITTVLERSTHTRKSAHAVFAKTGISLCAFDGAK